jgi:uncharacterized OsmC-like protein
MQKSGQAPEGGANVINGIDTDALKELIGEVAEDSEKALTHWRVESKWKGGTRSDAEIKGFGFGKEQIDRGFTIKFDEPSELGGTNLFANPQEYLMAALNACMIVGYAAGCAMEGIELEELRIETEGEIDLRGFFGLDPDVTPGYDEIRYKVYVRGNGTPEQFRKIHETVNATSPNRFNIAKPIRLVSKLIVE